MFKVHNIGSVFHEPVREVRELVMKENPEMEPREKMGVQDNFERGEISEGIKQATGNRVRRDRFSTGISQSPTLCQIPNQEVPRIRKNSAPILKWNLQFCPIIVLLTLYISAEPNYTQASTVRVVEDDK